MELRICVTCPRCSRRFSASQRLEGRKIKCASCSVAFRVPVESGGTSARPATPARPAATTPAEPGSKLLEERRRVRIQALSSGAVMAVALTLLAMTAMRGHLVPLLVLPLVGTVVVLTRACLRLDAIEKVLEGSNDRQARYESRVRKTRAMASQTG